MLNSLLNQEDKQSWNKSRAIKMTALGLVLVGALVVMVSIVGGSAESVRLESKNNVMTVVKQQGERQSMQVAVDFSSENSCRNYCYLETYQNHYNYPNYLRCEQMCFSGRFAHWTQETQSCISVCNASPAPQAGSDCHAICYPHAHGGAHHAVTPAVKEEKEAIRSDIGQSVAVKTDKLPSTKCSPMLTCNEDCRSACGSGWVSCYIGCLNSPECAVSCAKQMAKPEAENVASKQDVAMQVMGDNWTSENSCRDFCYHEFYQLNYNYPNYLRCEQMCFSGRYAHWQPRSSSCLTVCYSTSGTGNCHTICSA